jgi:hypothetical protein
MRTGVICMHQQEQERCPYLQLTEDNFRMCKDIKNKRALPSDASTE